ncbi:hypothetical protein ACP70R_042032 [Stipagrostis hirtigluma subsp. patula]
MAANEAEQAAAPTNAAANARPAPMLDTELFMAARRGDSERLKALLELEDQSADEQAGTVEPATAVAAAAAAQQVVVEVGRWAGAGAAAAVDPAVVVVAVAAAQQAIEEVDPRPAALTDPTLVDGEQQIVAADDAPAAPSSGAALLLQLLDGVTSNEGDSLLHVVAAAGDGDEFRDCARIIYDNNNGLLVARNNKGDTPLHRAAAAGNDNMVSCLVALAAEAVKEEFLRMQNKSGETALHQAVRAASKPCIDSLMPMDPELVCIPREGQEGASPLYLAISLGEVEIARHLFDKSEAQTKRKLCYYSGPDGRNVLHAAVSRGQALTKLLEWIKGIKVDVKKSDRHISVSLDSHLTTQRDKQTGSTPVHLAASLAGWPAMGLLSKWFPHVWPGRKSATTLLLGANTCSAYQQDNKGLYPIHVAAMNGSLGAVNVLLQKCPDCATLQDAKGRTFLHIAVEKKRHWVVHYVCGTPKFSSILNVQDNEGDTALHRAIEVGNLGIFNFLIQNQHVRLDVPNKEALTPLDLSWRMIPPRFYYKSNRRSVIHSSLLWLGAPHGESRPDLFYDKHISIPEVDKKVEEVKNSQDLTNATQVMGIVSVLVATVTFASAFTLPGGYVQSASDGVLGTPVLAGSYVFDAFILADALAFMCSCLATFSLVFAGMAAMDLSIRMWCINFSFLFLKNSVRSLVAAFALGLYLMLASVAHTIAIAVCVITFSAWIYGNLEAWQIFCAAYTACARGRGISISAVCAYVLRFSVQLFQHFWSLVIIFGLPAIIRRIKVHHIS